MYTETCTSESRGMPTKKALRAKAKVHEKEVKVIRRMYRELGIEETNDECVLMVPNALLAGIGLVQEHPPQEETQQTGVARSLMAGISRASNALSGPTPKKETRSPFYNVTGGYEIVD